MLRFVFALSLVCVTTIDVSAGWRYRYQPAPYYYVPPAPTRPVMPYTPTQPTNLPAGDGLDEVNAKRAAAGLRPFIRDEGLTKGAMACAKFRADNLMFGHTASDFNFLPPGTSCAATGCAAYPPSFGWMSCCVRDDYRYAGAAWVMGADGRRFMSLFVR